MATRDTIAARLAEWGLRLNDHELDELMPVYKNLLRWQGVLEAMMQSKTLVDGMTAPASEPILPMAFVRQPPRLARSTYQRSTEAVFLRLSNRANLPWLRKRAKKMVINSAWSAEGRRWYQYGWSGKRCLLPME